MLLGRLGETVDRAFVELAFRSRRAGGRATRESVTDRIDEATWFYPEADRQGRLFPVPDHPRSVEAHVRGLPGGRVVDLRWPSAYGALHATHASTLARVPETAVNHARWFRHDATAPALICLHGWGAGRFVFEERAFLAEWLYRVGHDVILATLPFHARRSPRRRFTPMFPSTDPMRANEGFAQSIFDLRALVGLLRAHGAPHVGVTGMSLGGFTTALLATVEPGLDYAIPLIPFASLPELVWTHGHGTPARQRAESAGITRERFADAFTATTPLRRKPALDPRRMLIIAGERDHVTPPRHGRWLHEHFSGSRFLTFPGSHLVQHGRGQAFKALVRFAAEWIGQPAPRPAHQAAMGEALRA